jgi:ribonuclease P protein subunit RPR2
MEGKRGPSRGGAQNKKTGLDRIERLFELAERDFDSHPERAHRNVQLARKIATRYNIRMPKRFRTMFCRKCYKYLSPNINCRVKKSGSLLTIKCLECGALTKHTYDRKG